MSIDPVAVAHATERTIVDLPARFMLDMDTYVKGGGLGFEGVDFYIAGRGGALGDVPAAVVTAAFVFFAPEAIEVAWERAGKVMPPREAAQAFIEVGWDWADAHLSTGPDLDRTLDLLGRVVHEAPVAGAPLFAAWRAMPEPGPERPLALAVHRLNALRELRGALHGCAVLAAGVAPHQAVSDASPGMLGIFGWPGPHEAAGALSSEAWRDLRDATDRATAPAFAGLEADEAEALVAGIDALAASGS